MKFFLIKFTIIVLAIFIVNTRVFASSMDSSNPINSPSFQQVNPYTDNILSTNNPQNFSFTKTLKIGMNDVEVKYLQKVLNRNLDTQLAVTGAGSPGNETNYLGKLTLNAVTRFQKKYGLKVTGAIGEVERNKLMITNCNLNSPPSITIISPNGGENYSKGDLVNVKWQYCNLPATSIIKIDMNNYNTDFVGTFLGSQAGYILGSNQYTFKIPESANIPSGSYKITVSCTKDEYNNPCGSSGVSDNTFTINNHVSK